MTIQHHPDDSTIMAYAAGAIPEGFTLVLAAHLEICSRCDSRVREAEAIGGGLLMELSPGELPAGGLGDIWNRLEDKPIERPASRAGKAPVKGLPLAVSRYLDRGLEQLPWRSLVPGIKQHRLKELDSGKGSVRLLQISPGTTMPRHTHGGSELTLVLKGSYRDELGIYRTGDLADLDNSVHHQPVADGNETCVCLIATDQQLHFSGALSRMLQPLIGI